MKPLVESGRPAADFASEKSAPAGSFSPEELIRAVRTIHEGGALITPALAPALLTLVRDAMARDPHHDRMADSPSALLTPREVEVLELVRAGLPNRQIAERLCIEDARRWRGFRDSKRQLLSLRPSLE